MDKFYIAVSKPRITVFAKNEEDQECANVMQGLLNYKYGEILNETIERIKENIMKV